MKQNVLFWQFAGFCLTALGGTLLHFLYEWTGGALVAAPFSGVNESTWEHMKLLYFAWLGFALFQYRSFRDYRGFWAVKCRGLLAGLLTVPVLFYTYNGAFGKSPDWLNITIFFVATAVTYGVEYRLFHRGKLAHRSPAIPLGVILLVGVLFVAFTFVPPRLPLFRDPLTGDYGIPD